MDYKEKYEMALKGIQEILSSGEDSIKMSRLQLRLQGIFPELKESEDERIRKAIIDFFSEPGRKEYILKGFTVDDILAWLEKQGEQKQPSDIRYEVGNGGSLSVINGKPFDYEHATIHQMDFAPKQEPKFHEGEWLCENEPNNYARFIQILEIVNVQGKERYRISRDIHNDEDIVEVDFAEKYYHKFDIKDTKDGDVLASDNGNIILVKESRDSSWGYRLSYHCAVLDDGTFEPREFHVNPEKFFPATKEQRDLLFQKMKEAGYEWDTEKLEPIKVPKTKEPEGALKKLLDEQDKFYKEAKIVLEDKDTALAFLRRMGIIDEYGELADKYRSDQTPATTISAVNGAYSTTSTDGNTSVTCKEVEAQYCTGKYEPDVREFPIEWKEEKSETSMIS